jgi:hypothetical protein
MNENADQLRSAFEAHEHLAPDAAAVYARAQELARTYRRRRTGAQLAGGAVLGAGLIAGGLALPGRGGGPEQQVVVQAASAPQSTAPSAAEIKKDLAAYFAGGYDYKNAEALAALWNVAVPTDGDLDQVKAEAGRRLLAGETLPVKPNEEAEIPVDPKVQAEVDAFFKAGFTYDDAVHLSKLWSTKTPYDAKVEGGEKLLAGDKLPVAPGSSKPVGQRKKDVAVDAFFTKGYNYEDAAKLAKLWKTKSTYDAKVEAGLKLLAGQSLPFAP